MIKRLLATLAVCVLGLTALKADSFVGYDGGCQVWYRTYYGFYRACPDYDPIYLGWDWNGLTWNNGGFWRGGQRWRGGNWHGNWNRQGNWHGRNWHGQGHGGHAGHGHRGGH
jgi:hypothetical protein